MTLADDQKKILKANQEALKRLLEQSIIEMRRVDSIPIGASTKNYQLPDSKTIARCEAINLNFMEKHTPKGEDLDWWLVYSHFGLLLHYESNKIFPLKALGLTINIFLKKRNDIEMSKETIDDIVKNKMQPQIGESYSQDFETWVQLLSIQLKSLVNR